MACQCVFANAVGEVWLRTRTWFDYVPRRQYLHKDIDRHCVIYYVNGLCICGLAVVHLKNLFGDTVGTLRLMAGVDAWTSHSDLLSLGMVYIGVGIDWFGRTVIFQREVSCPCT